MDCWFGMISKTSGKVVHSRIQGRERSGWVVLFDIILDSRYIRTEEKISQEGQKAPVML